MGVVVLQLWGVAVLKLWGVAVLWGLQCSVMVVGVAVLDLSAMLKRTLKR